MAINGRNKGSKAERIAAKVIEKWTNKKFSKTPASGGLGWKKSNVAGDIVCTTEGHFFPFTIEVKFYKKIDFSHLITPGIKNIDILEYWEQAKRDATRVNKIPMLLMRYNGLPKEFFYVVLETQFLDKLPEIEIMLHTKNAMAYFSKEKNLSLTILRSDEFFKTNYKPIKKIAKTIINESKGK